MIEKRTRISLIQFVLVDPQSDKTSVNRRFVIRTSYRRISLKAFPFNPVVGKIKRFVRNTSRDLLCYCFSGMNLWLLISSLIDFLLTAPYLDTCINKNITLCYIIIVIIWMCGSGWGVMNFVFRFQVDLNTRYWAKPGDLEQRSPANNYSNWKNNLRRTNIWVARKDSKLPPDCAWRRPR